MTNKAALPDVRIASKFRAALFGLARGWAGSFQARENEALHPLRRQPITHDPRIDGALRTTQDAHDLGNTNPLALGNKIHDRSKTKAAQCARKDLRCAAQCAV